MQHLQPMRHTPQTPRADTPCTPGITRRQRLMGSVGMVAGGLAGGTVPAQASSQNATPWHVRPLQRRVVARYDQVSSHPHTAVNRQSIAQTVLREKQLLRRINLLATPAT